MEYIKSKLGSIGLLLATLGLVSMVLSFFNYEIRLLAWIGLWGNAVAWIIRIALIIGGMAIFILVGNSEEDEEEE